MKDVHRVTCTKLCRTAIRPNLSWSVIIFQTIFLTDSINSLFRKMRLAVTHNNRYRSIRVMHNTIINLSYVGLLNMPAASVSYAK